MGVGLPTGMKTTNAAQTNDMLAIWAERFFPVGKMDGTVDFMTDQGGRVTPF